jgi:hypothetical protein
MTPETLRANLQWNKEYTRTLCNVTSRYIYNTTLYISDSFWEKRIHLISSLYKARFVFEIYEPKSTDFSKLPCRYIIFKYTKIRALVWETKISDECKDFLTMRLCFALCAENTLNNWMWSFDNRCSISGKGECLMSTAVGTLRTLISILTLHNSYPSLKIRFVV